MGWDRERQIPAASPWSRKPLNAPSETQEEHHGRLAGQEHVFPAVMTSRRSAHLLSPHVMWEGNTGDIACVVVRGEEKTEAG